MDLVGCTVQELRDHLESKFTDGMSWENHGEWHVDHIKPCASYALADEAQQKECFHYTNLQPLWANDNMSKGSLWEGTRHRQSAEPSGRSGGSPILSSSPAEKHKNIYNV